MKARYRTYQIENETLQTLHIYSEYELICSLHFPLPPQESQIQRIFGTMINQKLQDFDEDVKPLGDMMTRATIEVYNFISTRMLPTPTKIHYLFNLRDISKVVESEWFIVACFGLLWYCLVWFHFNLRDVYI